MLQINISQKEKIGISIAAIIFFLAIADRLILTPISCTLGQINRQTNIAERKLAYSLNNLNQKELIEGEYQKYGLQLKANGSDEEKTTSMLSEIENLAKKSGVSLVDIKPQPSKNVDFYKELIIEVNAQGSMRDLVRFLHDLHDSPVLFCAQNLHLDLKDKDSAIVNALITVTKMSI